MAVEPQRGECDLKNIGHHKKTEGELKHRLRHIAVRINLELFKVNMKSNLIQQLNYIDSRFENKAVQSCSWKSSFLQGLRQSAPTHLPGSFKLSSRPQLQFQRLYAVLSVPQSLSTVYLLKCTSLDKMHSFRTPCYSFQSSFLKQCGDEQRQFGKFPSPLAVKMCRTLIPYAFKLNMFTLFGLALFQALLFESHTSLDKLLQVCLIENGVVLDKRIH